VLKNKGVKFEFFHRVEELIPSAGRIEQIRMSVQAQPIAPAYEPLVEVKGLPCWPTAPRYELLVNGRELQDGKIDLEGEGRRYALFEKTLTYRADKDGFDSVILGIPPGALVRICARLRKKSRAWDRMLAHVATVSTQVLQLWSDCAMSDFGGLFVQPYPPPDAVGPTCTSFDPPFDTWADMSHLLKQESWGATAPRNVAYFCGVMADPPTEPAGGKPPPAASDLVRANVVGWLNRSVGGLWPEAVDAEGFRWPLLRAAPDKRGEDRLDEQYWRANIAGSERYVLSLPGTLKYRLRPGASGFANLYLAGDWVRVAAFNAGCMEVAVMGGWGAAAALAGCDDGVIV
jgi:uncharacterized protein with NAD-binding domain and iron-sulfur cluster